MAAVLAGGDGAVLSHGSAAALWKMLRATGAPIDISVPTQGGRASRVGLRIHRCASLTDASLLIGEEPLPSTTIRNGIPVTAPWRTIEDLRGDVPWRLYRRAVRQAELQGFALLPRDRGDGTRSDLEDDFLDFVRRHGFSCPDVNVKLGRWEVDFVWREERVVVETDFYGTHRGSIAFEGDHQRDMDLRGMGYSVHRYTGAQLRDYPAEIVAELGEVLAPRAAPLESPRHRPRPRHSAS
jgi:very-short-patch-repair endonuclease